MDNDKIVEAELRIGNTIREALRTKGKDSTPDDVLRMKQEVVDHLAALETAVTEQEAKISDFTTEPEAVEEAQRLLNVYCGQQSRFTNGLAQLDELLAKVTVRTRDEQQKADYKVLKRRAENLSELIKQDLPAVERFASALLQVEQYHEEIKRFNQPQQGDHVNPMDRLVSKYDLLPPIMLDAVLSASVIIGQDGKALYVGGGTSKVSHPTPMSPNPVDTVHHAYEVERLKQAQEAQNWAKNQLVQLERDASTRQTDVETVASWRGLTTEHLKRIQDRADGKEVAKAQAALERAQGTYVEPKKDGASGGL